MTKWQSFALLRSFARGGGVEHSFGAIGRRPTTTSSVAPACACAIATGVVSNMLSKTIQSMLNRIEKISKSLHNIKTYLIKLLCKNKDICHFILVLGLGRIE
jgi:hypothetical protein